MSSIAEREEDRRKGRENIMQVKREKLYLEAVSTFRVTAIRPLGAEDNCKRFKKGEKSA